MPTFTLYMPDSQTASATAIIASPGFLQSGTGAVTRTMLAKAREVITPQDFGAAGDGTTDDTDAMNAFFTAVDGKRGYIPPGTYKLTSLISRAFTDCEIVGVPGASIITGAFGYAIIRLLDIENAHFHGITFRSTYSNATQDLGASVVYSYQNSVINSSFRFCTFTCPAANTSGLTFYARINTSDTSGTIDGLWVEDCNFIDVGRIGCTIMNRNTDAYSAAQRVYFNRNLGRGLGLQGSYGFLVSFDGYGRHFTCNNNIVENALGIGIENTRWSYGEFCGNSFADFQEVYAPMSFSGGMTHLTIRNNHCVEPANSRSNFINVSDSTFDSNYFNATGDYAFHMRAGTGNKFFGDTYKSDDIYAALIGSSATTTTDNEWDNCTFDTTDSSTNTSVCRFDGTNTTRNVLANCVINRGTGGNIVDQVNSAVGNYATNYRTSGSALPANQLLTAMSDADYTFVAPYDVLQYSSYRFTGTLTATRVVNFPPANTRVGFWVRNDTNYPLTMTPSGGAGATVYPGQLMWIASNGTNFQPFAQSLPFWNQEHIKLGSYSLWVDPSGDKLRIKNGAPTSASDGTVVGTQT